VRLLISSFVMVALLLVAPGPAGSPASEPPDRLAEALDSMGLTRRDLGFRPKSYWIRFPQIRRIPHLPHFFEDLYAEPLRLYEFARVSAEAAARFASPEYRSGSRDGMVRTVHYLGIDKKIVGPRGYPIPLPRAVEDGEGLLSAFERLYALGMEDSKRGNRGGDVLPASVRKGLMEQLDRVPGSLQAALADLLQGIAEACEWRRTAVRNVPEELMQKVFQDRSWFLRFPEDQKYRPEVDDVARLLDEVSLYHAALLAVQAVDDASRAFRAALRDLSTDLSTVYLDAPTPVGRVILSGAGDDTHVIEEGCAVLVDLGGNDVYRGPVAGTSSLDIPVSVLIDLEGNDIYDCRGRPAPSQGAGVFGVGILLDCDGDDVYKADTLAQGAGVFGLGLLWDEKGDDSRTLRFGGQGAGYFGVGLLVDVQGNDSSYLFGDGQGFGGPGGGVGVLADMAGDDHYVAEPDARLAGRGDYHTRGLASMSNAQGAGAGRRGDVRDGHAWAGGLGMLIDLDGNDTYRAGAWAGGSGFWFGTGILYDRAGNDAYRAVTYALGSAAHFSLAALFDESGNDTYALSDPAVEEEGRGTAPGGERLGGEGLAFGWDFSFAVLADKGGDDVYRARSRSGACAMIGSKALLMDLGGGSDTYYLPAEEALGATPPHASDAAACRLELSGFGPYAGYGRSIAVFLDVGGRDTYTEIGSRGQEALSKRWRNDAVWRWSSPTRTARPPESFGVGMDASTGDVADLRRFEPES